MYFHIYLINFAPIYLQRISISINTCRMDIVHRIYMKINEQSVKSSPIRLRCEMFWMRLKGRNGSLATVRPSNLKHKRFHNLYFLKLVYAQHNVRSQQANSLLVKRAGPSSSNHMHSKYLRPFIMLVRKCYLTPHCKIQQDLVDTYIELNILSRAVNAKPIANMDFIFT